MHESSTREFIYREEQRRRDRSVVQENIARFRRQRRINEQAETAGRRIAKAVEQPHQEWDAKFTRVELQMEGRKPEQLVISSVYTPLGITTEIGFRFGEQLSRIRLDQEGISAFAYKIEDEEIVPTEKHEITATGVKMLQTLAEQLESA